MQVPFPAMLKLTVLLIFALCFNGGLTCPKGKSGSVKTTQAPIVEKTEDIKEEKKDETTKVPINETNTDTSIEAIAISEKDNDDADDTDDGDGDSKKVQQVKLIQTPRVNQSNNRAYLPRYPKLDNARRFLPFYPKANYYPRFSSVYRPSALSMPRSHVSGGGSRFRGWRYF